LDLDSVYRTVADEYVDHVDGATLVRGAMNGFHDAAVEAGLMPIDSALVETVPLTSTGNDEQDWLRLARAFQTFVDKIGTRGDVNAVADGTIRGLLDSIGDSDSVFLDRRAVQARQEGGIVGIGVTLAAPGSTGSPIVREVLPGSPAAEADVRSGDTIVQVDGVSTESMTLADVVRAIRGPEATPVTIALQAAEEATAREVTVTRAPLRVPAVQATNIEGVEYVRIRSFRDGVADSVREQLVSSLDRGASGWVVDLRGNSGGSLTEVASVASIFLGDDIVGIEIDRARRRVPIQGRGAPIGSRPTTIVLVDEGTASGAEVLAAALKERGLATLVGMPTAGRVRVGSVIPLSDGSAAQITTERVLSPSGGDLDGIGVRPDVLVSESADDWVHGDDPQLDRALAELGARP